MRHFINDCFHLPYSSSAKPYCRYKSPIPLKTMHPPHIGVVLRVSKSSALQGKAGQRSAQAEKKTVNQLLHHRQQIVHHYVQSDQQAAKCRGQGGGEAECGGCVVVSRL